MFSFKSIVLIATAFTIGAECSGVAVQAAVAAPLVAPAHVGYAHAVPQNIPPYAAQVNHFSRAFSPYVAATYAAPLAAPVAAPVPPPFAAPVAAPFAASVGGPFAAPVSTPFATPFATQYVAGAPSPYALPGQAVPAAFGAPYPYAAGAPFFGSPFAAPAFVR